MASKASRGLAARGLKAYQGLLESHAQPGSLAVAAFPVLECGAATRALARPPAGCGTARLLHGRHFASLLFPPPAGLASASALARQGPRAFHSALWQAQQLQKEAAVPPPPPPPPPPHAAAAPEAARHSAIQDWADAEECDEAMEDLEKTQRRVSALRSPPPGHVPLTARARAAASATAKFASATAAFLAAVPGAVARFAARPRAERRAAYRRWWCVVKREAKHYWVGTKLLGKDVRIASRLVSKVLSGKALSRCARTRTPPAAHLPRGVCAWLVALRRAGSSLAQRHEPPTANRLPPPPPPPFSQARAAAADPHHGRHLPPGPHAGVRGHPLYGAPAARRAQALPQHAALHL
jgi:hypothetical protein